MGIAGLFPYGGQPQREEETSPVLTQPTPAEGSGGFWGGLLDLLKNVPLTLGDAKHGRTQLPSYNELTAARPIADFGKRMGVDTTGLERTSPAVAKSLVDMSLAHRQQAPLGLEFANQFIPVTPGEGPEVASTRHLIANLPRSAGAALLSDLMQTYGVLPGMQGPPLDTSAVLSQLPSRTDQPVTQTPMVLPQPQPQPSAPLGVEQPAAMAPQPAFTPSPLGHALATAQAPVASPPVTPGAPAGARETAPASTPSPSGQALATAQAPYTSQAAPTSAVAPAVGIPPPSLPTSAIAPMATPAGQLGMPQPPRAPEGTIYREDVAEHPSVLAAEALYRAQPTAKNRAAVLAARAGAPHAIRQERHQQYLEGAKEYANQLQAWAAAHKTMREDTEIEREVAKAKAMLPLDVQKALAIEEGKLPLDIKKLVAGEQAKAATQEGIREGQTLFDVVGRDPEKLNQFRDPQTARPLPPDTPYPQARQAAAILPAEQTKRLDDILDAMPIVPRLNYYVQQIYGPDGLYAKMSGDERRSLTQGAGRAVAELQQRYPILAEANAYMDANAEKVARAIGGLRGAATENDVKRMKSLFTELSSGLTVRWKGWIPLPDWSMLDTRAVAMQKINALNTTLDRVTGTIVKNPNFQHEGLLPRTPETPGQPMSTSGKMPEPASLTLTPTERVLGKMGPGPAPGTQPPPGKPEKRPIPNDERAKQAVYKQMGITAPPHAGREPEKFEQFLGALRQHMA